MYKYIIFIGLFFLCSTLCIAHKGHGGHGVHDIPSEFLLDIKSNGYSIEININNYPIYNHLYDGDQVSNHQRIGGFILKGKNALSIKLTPSNNTNCFIDIAITLPKSKSQTEATKLWALTSESQYMSKKNGKNFPKNFNWKCDKEAHISYENDSYIFSSILYTQLSPFQSFPWQEKIGVINSKDKQAITKAVLSLEEACLQKNLTEIIKKYRLKYHRYSKAFARSKDSMEKGHAYFLKNIFAAKQYSVKKINPDKLIIKQYNKANLVQVLNGQSLPIIIKHDTKTLQVPLFLSRINGEWVIVE